MATKLSFLFVCTFLFVPVASGEESRQLDLRTAEAFDQVFEMLGKLDGRMTKMERADKARIVAEEATKNPKVLELAAFISKTIKDQKHTDQQQAFVQALAEMACRTLQDGCELKSRLNEFEFRLRELERKQQNLNEPTPEPMPHAPPRSQPVWSGRIDYITDRMNNLCPRAVLLAQCIDKEFADGDVYHGNIYLDCHGRYVFVRHTKTTPDPYVVAKPIAR
jgi:hypothetical protein